MQEVAAMLTGPHMSQLTLALQRPITVGASTGMAAAEAAAAQGAGSSGVVIQQCTKFAVTVRRWFRVAGGRGNGASVESHGGGVGAAVGRGGGEGDATWGDGDGTREEAISGSDAAENGTSGADTRIGVSLGRSMRALSLHREEEALVVRKGGFPYMTTPWDM